MARAQPLPPAAPSAPACRPGALIRASLSVRPARPFAPAGAWCATARGGRHARRKLGQFLLLLSSRPAPFADHPRAVHGRAGRHDALRVQLRSRGGYSRAPGAVDAEVGTCLAHHPHALAAGRCATPRRRRRATSSRAGARTRGRRQRARCAKLPAARACACAEAAGRAQHVAVNSSWAAAVCVCVCVLVGGALAIGEKRQARARPSRARGAREGGSQLGEGWLLTHVALRWSSLFAVPAQRH